MEPWQSILVAIGGNATLLAVLGWLSQSIVGRMLDKDLESHKAELSRESESAAEKLRHELKVVAVEHEVRFSKLHAQRAETITKIYSLLVDSYLAIDSFVSLTEWFGEQSKREKYKTAMNATAEFFNYFERNRIFLPEAICEQLEAFVDEMRKKAIGFGVYLNIPDAETAPDEVAKERHAAWIEAWEFVSTSVPPARIALERELRKILGGAD